MATDNVKMAQAAEAAMKVAKQPPTPQDPWQVRDTTPEARATIARDVAQRK